MISVTDLAFNYPGKGKDVFKELNLQVENGVICGLLGKNGMGKSTLLYLICGLLEAKKGNIVIDGLEAKDRMPELLSEIFLVTEDFEMPAMKMSDYVKANSCFYPKFSEDLMQKCLKEFEMEGDPMLNKLSMGQKKKIYMSFALATGTKYLIMDEPTNGLDIPSKSQFRKVVASAMAEDRTMIISTHQVHDVDTLLDHVVILDHSQVLMNKSVAEICNEYVFEYRMPDDMEDAIYAEPTLQGNAVMALRGEKEETTLNLELLFNAVTRK